MIRNRRLMYLSSANRISGTDSSNFTIQVPIPPHETFTHVCLLEANIPKSYYLVQAGYNTFILLEQGIPITITITPANYTATCFKTCLAEALNAASLAGWVYSVGSPSSTQPATGRFTYAVVGPGGGNQPSFVFTTNLYEQLGFNFNSTNTFVGGALTSANVVRFQSEDALYIHSDIVA